MNGTSEGKKHDTFLESTNQITKGSQFDQKGGKNNYMFISIKIRRIDV